MGRNKKILTMNAVVDRAKWPPVLYGLQGIMDIFHVSKATASRYKNTIFKDAVAQQGNVIVVDVEECLRLFGLLNPSGLIDKS